MVLSPACRQDATGGLFGNFGIGQHEAEYEALEGIQLLPVLLQVPVISLKTLRRVNHAAERL